MRVMHCFALGAAVLVPASVAAQGYPGKSCTYHRAVRGGRRHRYRGARGGAKIERTLVPAGDRRQSRRRRRQYRRRACREERARWLHAVHDLGLDRDREPAYLQENAVRSGQGPGAGDQRRERSAGPDRDAELSAENRQGVDRSRQVAAAPDFVRIGGFRQPDPPGGRKFLYTAKIEVVHIPYKGEAPAIVDTMAGQVPFSTPNLAASINFIQQNKLRALGVTSKQRAPQLPNVPAVAETLPGFENLGWFGFMVPAGTSKEVVDKVYRDTAKALEAADVQKPLRRPRHGAGRQQPRRFRQIRT